MTQQFKSTLLQNNNITKDTAASTAQNNNIFQSMDHFKSFNVGGGGASSLPQMTTENVLIAMAASHETGTDLRTRSELSCLHPNTQNTENKLSTSKSKDEIKTVTPKSKSNDSYLRSNSATSSSRKIPPPPMAAIQGRNGA